MYLVDRIEWPSFYDLLARIVVIRDELKRNEAIFRPLVQKWKERNSDITIMCISIIQLSRRQFENTFELLSKLQGFDDKQDSFQKRLTICFSKYFAGKYDLFPCALKSVDKVKDKEEWKRELDEIFFEKMKKKL